MKEVTFLPPQQYAQLQSELEQRPVTMPLNPLPVVHSGPTRKERRRATAQFEGPKDEPGLRRKLLKQRQRRARGTFDVETRRLQRKALQK